MKAFVTISFFALLSCALTGQPQFTGKWEFDKSLSSKDHIESTYNGTVILNITQDPSSISFSQTWKSPGNSDWNTSTESYQLDGKETVKKNDVGTNKKSARFSPDKKSIIIRNLDIQELQGKMQEFQVDETYSISDDSKILTIAVYSKNPVTGEMKTKKVLHRIE